MPFVGSGDARIYCEVHGEGEPLLFLNGIMMSTASWAGLIPELSRRFRLILMDFRDQGQSSKMGAQYDQHIHVGDVIGVLDQLKISTAHVMGPSYGGQVALLLSSRHPGRIKSLCLINTPGKITRRLSEIGRAWEEAAALNDGAKFFSIALPFIYSELFYETHQEYLQERRKVFESMLTREWFDAFVRLSRSAGSSSISPEELRNIRIPTLVVGADQDTVVSHEAMNVVRENIPDCEYLLIPDSGHASFLEKPNEFLTVLTGFVLRHS